MRMWMIDPKLMCRKHLVSEHSEMHLLVGTIAAGKSIQGYIDLHLVNTPDIRERHDALAAEMVARGHSHKSPLPLIPAIVMVRTVKHEFNLFELARRCPTCRSRMEMHMGLEKFAHIPEGGDAIWECDPGVWQVKLSGKVLDTKHTVRAKALQEMEKLRREIYR